MELHSSCLASALAPEVVLHLLSFLPRPAVATAVITCKAWKDPALDILWKDVDLENLLKVLGTEEDEDGVLVRSIGFLPETK